MELFVLCAATVSGLLAPLVVLGLIIWGAVVISDLVKTKKMQQTERLENIKKSLPYDTLFLGHPPNKNKVTVQLIKNEEVVHEQSFDKYQLLEAINREGDEQ